MLPEIPAIRPLPEEVAAQIKSSITISSLSSVVLGLVENSLDAGANTIEIYLDYGRGTCSVEDDGHGIAPVEFGDGGGLVKPYRE